jgi:hypothetical protein
MKRTFFVVTVCTLLLATAASPVLAATKVGFTATKEQVDKACTGVSGIPVSGGTGGGYGCYNPKNGVLVGCSKSHACTGYIPRKIGSTKIDGLLGVLTNGLQIAPADGGGTNTSPKKDQKPAPSTPTDGTLY